MIGIGRRPSHDLLEGDTLAKRISGIANSLPKPAAQYEQIVATCRALDSEARADKLVKLTLKQ